MGLFQNLLLLLLLVSTFSNGVRSCMEEERQALVSFKQDLIDYSGRLSSWVGTQCCLWRGISCSNRTGHVVKLNLRNPYPYPGSDPWDSARYYWNFTKFQESSLGGKLNPSLLGLKHLTYLDLSRNSFEEIHIPNFIGELTSLRYLNLSFGSSVGEIPPSLGNLSNLNYLDLSFGVYSNPKNLNWVSHLSSLKYLSLSGVNLSETAVSLLHAVNMLPSLLELHLSSCSIYGNQLLPSLPTINFTSLLILDLSVNDINSSFPKWMFNLTSLTKLDLRENPFTRPSLDEFVRLKSLEYLDLSWGVGLKGQLLPKFFANLCGLESLDLSYNKFDGGIEEFLGGFSNCSFNRMESLSLAYCGLKGKLPSSIGLLKGLQHLNLGSNYFWGFNLEFLIGNLSSLKTLDLSGNLFNGSIPQSIGKLSQLVSLDLSSNSWDGSLREAHFINLTRLKSLTLGTTLQMPIIFNLTNYEWIPPFKLRIISMDNCRVGPGFPIWLQSQTELFYVTVTNAGISGAISEDWLFKISSTIKSLDFSYNQISGKLPFKLYSFPNLEEIVLSHNEFDGTIPSSICHNIQYLSTLALNNNQLSGEFSKEWSLWSYIQIVDVSNNNLSGNIPSSMGVPSSLEILKIDNNHFSGEIPSTLQNCTELERLYLGGNNFTGSIPSWIGSKVFTITVLQLRSNSLSGHIPHHLCTLHSLRILDLSRNSFSGTVPKCLNNLTSLATGHFSWRGSGHFEETIVTVKGRESEYFLHNAMLLTIIDLSSNDLEGEIPEEISSLVQLGTLNLSMNHFSGSIPSKIGNLHWLETLDLSQNHLSGHIPQSLSNLTFLSHLNLSHNNLTGRIPTGSQLQTLNDASIYGGNPSLCGFPLAKCLEDGNNVDEPNAEDNEDHGDDDEKLGFYISAVLGFVIGFWSVFGTLVLKKSCRYAYFQFFDHIKEKVARAITK